YLFTKQDMKFFRSISTIRKLRIQSLLFIAVCWTVTDYLFVLVQDPNAGRRVNSIQLRELIIFIGSLIIGYLFVFRMKKIFRHYPLWLNFTLKSLILLVSAFVIIFCIQFLHNIYILHQSSNEAFRVIIGYALHKDWLLKKVLYWLIIFFVTQLILIINEKY